MTPNFFAWIQSQGARRGGYLLRDGSVTATRAEAHEFTEAEINALANEFLKAGMLQALGRIPVSAYF